MVQNVGPHVKKLLNGVLFYIGWFFIVVSAAQGLPLKAFFFAVMTMVFHFTFIDRQAKECVLVASLVGFGFILDTIFVLLGLLVYESPDPWISWGAPLWILGIHAIFASTIYHSLSWLGNYPWVSAVLGALGSFFTYVAGNRLGAVVFLLPGIWSPIIIGAVWFFYLPLVYLYADWLKRRFE